ncbi:MAG: hypothetical protein ABSH45_02875 [Bryobacteraceae bacterium]
MKLPYGRNAPVARSAKDLGKAQKGDGADCDLFGRSKRCKFRLSRLPPIQTPTQTWSQAYTYDGVNRLLTAAENVTGWTQDFGYDNNGNMYVSSQTNLGAIGSTTPQSPSWFANGKNQASDPANAWGYDLAGSLTGIPAAGWVFTYDAENRQVEASG